MKNRCTRNNRAEGAGVIDQMDYIMTGETIVRKITNAPAEVCEPSESIAIKCSHCGHDFLQQTYARSNLPAGVKFNPSDQELLTHLAAQVGKSKPHPFIDMLIPTWKTDENVCNPQKLPGLRNDGSSTYYFQRVNKTRRRMKGGEESSGSWKQTGTVRPISENGQVLGFKKIMVLYDSKLGKTNWVTHQFSLGLKGNKEELVLSKIFYQSHSRLSGKEREADDDTRDELSETAYHSFVLERKNPLPREEPCALGMGTGAHDDTRVDVSMEAEFPTPTVHEEKTSIKEAPCVPVTSVACETELRGFLEQLEEGTRSLWMEIDPSMSKKVDEAVKRQCSPIPILEKEAEDLGCCAKRDDEHVGLHTPAVIEDVQIGANEGLEQVEEANGVQHATESQSHERIQLGTPPDYLLSTQEAEEMVEGVVNQLSLMTTSQELSESCI